MSFGTPLWLLGLAALPVMLAGYLVARRRARRYAVRFPAVTTLRLATTAGGSWQRHVSAALALAAIAALVLALARPHMSYRAAVNEASMVLVTDHSGSMAATDVRPTRLAAAERAADTFIDQLPSTVRVGAVAYSSSPDAAQAPVTNHAAARAVIAGQAADGATATGSALELALQLLHGGDPKHAPSGIVLLSDGASNTGPDPLSVARQAAQQKIAVYTVALGTEGGTLPNPDPFGPPVAVPPDPRLMQEIARISGGRAFNAQSAGELSSIYQRLGSQLGSVHRTREVTSEFAAAGLVLLVLAALASVIRAGRLP